MDDSNRPPTGQTTAPPRDARHALALVLIGAVAGAASGMNALTAAPDPAKVSGAMLAAYLSVGTIVGTIAVPLVGAATRRFARSLAASGPTTRRLLRADAWTNLFLLLPLLGALGVQFVPFVIVAAAVAFAALKGVAFYAVLDRGERRGVFTSLGWLAFLFLVSGFAALIYQIVWQRVMFAAFGVNIESITVIVSLFMFGLGLGSLVGGVIARRYPGRAPLLFLICEVAIGLFGVASVPLIKAVSRATLHGSLLEVSLAIFALLCVPTMLMGATLPILVSHLYRYYQNLGKSVGLLYCINTVGSAAACFITADVLFVLMGEQASVIVAAVCNLVVGVLVMLYAVRVAREEGSHKLTRMGTNDASVTEGRSAATLVHD